MIQRFEIAGRLDGLNEYTSDNRANARGGGKAKRRNQDRVVKAIRAARLKPMRTPVDVRITWVEGEKPGCRRFVPRDKDNISFAKKFVLDALVETGVIADDGWKHIGGLSDRFLLNRKDPRIIVEVEEVG